MPCGICLVPLKPGFHMVAMQSSTIAAIIAIVWKPLSSDRNCNGRCDRWRVVSI